MTSNKPWTTSQHVIHVLFGLKPEQEEVLAHVQPIHSCRWPPYAQYSSTKEVEAYSATKNFDNQGICLCTTDPRFDVLWKFHFSKFIHFIIWFNNVLKRIINEGTHLCIGTRNNSHEFIFVGPRGGRSILTTNTIIWAILDSLSAMLKFIFFFSRAFLFTVLFRSTLILKHLFILPIKTPK